MRYHFLRAGCLLAFGVFATGCVPTASVAPGEPSAKLRIISKQMLGRQIWLYENESCDVGKTGGSMGYVGGIVGGGEQSELNMIDPQPRSNRIIERVIPAGRQVVFSVIETNGLNPTGVRSDGIIGQMMSYCTVTTKFMPRAGAQYEAVYTDDKGNCGVLLNELVQNSGGSVERRKEPTAAENGIRCGMKDSR